MVWGKQRGGIWLSWLLVTSGTIGLITGLATGAGPKPPFGTMTTLSLLPADPGFPEGIAVAGSRIYVSGPARFGTAGTGPSAIQVLDRDTGVRLTTITVQGEALAFEHALSNVAVDGEGRVYALSTQLGLLRFVKQGAGYVQEYFGAPLPDLPAAATADPGEPSSPTAFDLPPIINDIVLDDAGYAYVTDSLQATIFRYSPAGGEPEIWLQSAAFEGGGFLPFGTNGVRLDPAREFLYVAVTTSAANPLRGAIYRVPLTEFPDESQLELVHEYLASEGPDQLAFGHDGTLYVSLAFVNQISLLAPGIGELGRISSPPGADVPLDNPAALAFDSKSKSLLVANHALLSGDPSHFAVLKIYVNDPGDPLSRP